MLKLQHCVCSIYEDKAACGLFNVVVDPKEVLFVFFIWLFIVGRRVLCAFIRMVVIVGQSEVPASVMVGCGSEQQKIYPSPFVVF